MVTLPDGVDACDIGTITIWCEPFRAIFTRLEIPRSTFVRDSERKGEREGGERSRCWREKGGGSLCLASICYCLGTSVTNLHSYFS